MQIEGGCYCKQLRYTAEGTPLFEGQCHCRECQYISGGHPNAVMGMPAVGFTWTKGEPSGFARADLPNPVLREFCGTCGTHILARSPSLPAAVLLKVGTFDDPGAYAGPSVVIYACDKQPFHVLPEGVPTFDRLPG